MHALRFVSKAVVIIIIVTILLAVLSPIFIPYFGKTSYRDYELADVADQQIDVMFIGSSSMLTGAAPLIIWDASGITSFNMSNTLQSPLVMYHQTVEFFKQHTPKLVVLGAISLCESYDYDADEGQVRMIVDAWRPSLNKLEAIYSIIKRSNGQTAISYILPLLRYSDRWSQLTQQDFDKLTAEHNAYKRGHWADYSAMDVTDEMSVVKENGEIIPLDSDAEYYFKKTIDFCREQGSEVLLLSLPSSKWSSDRHVSIKQFAEENGVNFLDIALDSYIKQMGIDYQIDFYNGPHLNPYGSVKSSRCIARYIADNYDIEDTRGDAETSKIWKKPVDQYFKDLIRKADEIFTEQEFQRALKGIHNF